MALLDEARRLHFDQSDCPSALVQYRRLIEDHPLSAEAREAQLGLSGCYRRLGRYNEAENLLASLLETTGGEHRLRALMILSSVYQEQGRAGEARQCLEEVRDAGQVPWSDRAQAALGALDGSSQVNWPMFVRGLATSFGRRVAGLLIGLGILVLLRRKTSTGSPRWQLLVREWTIVQSSLLLGFLWFLDGIVEAVLALVTAVQLGMNRSGLSTALFLGEMARGLMLLSVVIVVLWREPRRGYCPPKGMVAIVSSVVLGALGVVFLAVSWVPLSRVNGGSVADADPILGGVAALVIRFIVVPAAEECIYRGAMYQAVRSRFGPLPGALVTSIVFSIAHGYDFSNSIFCFLFSCYSAWLVERYRTLFVPFAFHSLVNVLIFL